MSYTYEYPHPAVATDCVVFGFNGRSLEILLVERGVEPFKGAWAFPGGFLQMDETAEEIAPLFTRAIRLPNIHLPLVFWEERVQHD